MLFGASFGVLIYIYLGYEGISTCTNGLRSTGQTRWPLLETNLTLKKREEEFGDNYFAFDIKNYSRSNFSYAPFLFFMPSSNFRAAFVIEREVGKFS